MLLSVLVTGPRISLSNKNKYGDAGRSCFNPLNDENQSQIQSLVFRRKDLCEARVKPEMSSYFQMKCTAQVYPLARDI